MTMIPFGFNSQTVARPMTLNAAPTMNRPDPQQMRQQQSPGWYQGMLNQGAKQFGASGGVDPAGLQSGADWFKNYYGGYTGGVPVQQGLLGAAAQGLTGDNRFAKMGIPQGQLGGLAQNYASQFAQGNLAGALRGNDAKFGAGGFQNYLQGMGYGQRGNRGLLDGNQAPSRPPMTFPSVSRTPSGTPSASQWLGTTGNWIGDGVAGAMRSGSIATQAANSQNGAIPNSAFSAIGGMLPRMFGF